MPRLLVVALCLALAAFAPTQSLPPTPLADTDTVIIDTGTKTITALYHRRGCAWLRTAVQASMTLRDAKARYFQPHCLCITGRDASLPCPSAVTAEAPLPATAAPPLPLAAACTPVAETVYITRTGEKYHRAGCRSLARSSIPMALDQAARRYGACKICQPPVLSAPAVPAAVAPVSPRAPASNHATRQQCAATTKKGTRCSRNGSAGSSFCWQHGG